MTAKQRKYFGKKGSRKGSGSRTRTVTKWRTRRVAAAKSPRKFRRAGGGGGLPFRSSGSLIQRLQGSVVPVTKTVAPIVAGAVAGAMLAKFVGPKFKGSTVKTGAAVLAVSLLIGSFSGKAGRGLARTVAFGAIGMAADGAMRLLANARAAGKVPGLPRGNAGLLAGLPEGMGEEADNQQFDFTPSN